MRNQVRPTITGIAHVELSVNDVDASVAWYCRVLGTAAGGHRVAVGRRDV